MHTLFNQLQQESKHLGLSLSPATLERLLAYQDMLLLWNTAYNLTAIREPQQVLVRHILDCLVILPHLPEGRLLDVGTGGGLPGMIIALCQPERQCVLLDSNGKKIRFLRQVAADLNVTNAMPVQVRVEDTQAQAQLGRFKVVTSRAFASLQDIVKGCLPYCAPDGVLACMKAAVLPEEWAPVGELATLQVELIPLSVPQLDEARNLVLLRRLSQY